MGGAVAVAQRQRLTHMDAAALDAADADAAHVIVVIDIAEQHLRRAVHLALRCGDIAQDCLKQRLHVGAALLGGFGGVAIARGRV